MNQIISLSPETLASIVKMTKSLMPNPPNWKDKLVPFVGTFLAAGFGAWFAFELQTKRKKQEEDLQNFQSGKRAQFAFVTQYTTLSNLDKQYLNEKRKDLKRHLSLLPLISSSDFQMVDIDSILFILDGADANLLNEINVAQQKFLTVMAVLDQRSKYFSSFRENLSMLYNDDMNSAMNLVNNLQDMTDHLYVAFDDAITANEDIFKKMYSYLKKKYPRKTPLERIPL